MSSPSGESRRAVIWPHGSTLASCKTSSPLARSSRTASATVVDLQLDGRLRPRDVVGPGILAENAAGGVAQGPQAEVLEARQVDLGVVAPVLERERQRQVLT